MGKPVGAKVALYVALRFTEKLLQGQLLKCKRFQSRRRSSFAGAPIHLTAGFSLVLLRCREHAQGNSAKL